METKQPFQLTKKHQRFLAALSLIIFLLFSLAVSWFIGRPMLRLVEEPEQFRAWVDQRGVYGGVIFIGMVVIQVIVALIPGEPLEIGAGYAFGFWRGTFLSLAGIIIGSAIVFLLVRRFGTRLIEIFFTKEKIQSLRFLQNSRKRNILLFLIMLVPGTPKDLISYFAGLLDIPLSRWLLVVSIARLPSLVTSTIGGNAMGEERYLFAGIVFFITLVISLLGIAAYRKISREESAKEP